LAPDILALGLSLRLTLGPAETYLTGSTTQQRLEIH
jgi:hypothetical protein